MPPMTPVTTSALVGVLASCGAPAATASPPATPPTTPAPVQTTARPAAHATCVDPVQSVLWTWVRDHGLQTCWRPEDNDAGERKKEDDGPDPRALPSECWSFDATSGRWTAEPFREPPSEKAVWRPYAEAQSKRAVGLCMVEGSPCATITLSVDAPEYGFASTNADGSLVAVASGDLARVYDRTGAKLVDILPWVIPDGRNSKPAELQKAVFVGDSLALWARSNDGSRYEVRLFEPRTGKLLAKIPSQTGIDIETQFDLGNHQYGFVEYEVPIVHVVDATSGGVVHDLQYAPDDPSRTAHRWVQMMANKELIALDRTTAIVVHVATGKLARFPGPECKAQP